MASHRGKRARADRQQLLPLDRAHDRREANGEQRTDVDEHQHGAHLVQRDREEQRDAHHHDGPGDDAEGGAIAGGHARRKLRVNVSMLA